MRSIRSNGYLAVVLTFSFLLVMAAPALAVVKMNDVVNEVRNDTTVAATGKLIKESIKNRDGRKEFTAAELEEMRAALLGLLSTTYYATPLFDKGQASGQTADNYAELNAQINELSAVELTSFRTALNPVLIQQRLRVALEKINEAKNGSGSGTVGANVGSIPAVDYYCKGQAGELGISAPVTPATLSGSDDIFFIAEGIRDLAQNACNQVAVVVVLGEGGGANTRLACNISDAIYLIAKALNQKYHFCDADYNSSVAAATYGGISHLNTDIANGIASTATAITTSQNVITNNDNANKTTIVNNDNTNKNTIISNANANYVALNNTINAALASIIGNANANKDEIKNLLLRTQIEADLSVNDGQPFVGLYQVPATMCFSSFDSAGVALVFPQQCGLLDLVRSITRQTIANTGNDANALSSFNRAEGYRAQAKYADAYKYYRKAYKEAGK